MQKHNIATIIDMRSKKETAREPSGFADKDGFTYIHIPIEEGGKIPESVEHVGESYLEIAQAKNLPLVFKAIANAESGVMFNCTAGKDRTGVVSAVLLSLCGVSLDDVIYDYMITKVCSRGRFELLHKNFPEIDMNVVIPNERYMQEFLLGITLHYGGAKEYLVSIGVTEEETQKLVRKWKKI